MNATANPFWAWMPEDADLSLRGMVIQELAMNGLKDLLGIAVHIGGLTAIVIFAWNWLVDGDWTKAIQRIVLVWVVWFALNLPMVRVGGPEIMVRGDEAVTNVTVARVSAPFYWIMSTANAAMGGLSAVFAKATKESVVKYSLASRQVMAAKVSAGITGVGSDELRVNLGRFIDACMGTENLSKLQVKETMLRNGDRDRTVTGWDSAFAQGRMDYLSTGATQNVSCQEAVGLLDAEAKAWAKANHEKGFWAKSLWKLWSDERKMDFMIASAFENAAKQATKRAETRGEEFEDISPGGGGVVTALLGGGRKLQLWLTGEQGFGLMMGVVSCMIYALWPVFPLWAAILGTATPLIRYVQLVVWVRSWPLFYIIIRLIDDGARSSMSNLLDEGIVADAPAFLHGLLRSFRYLPPDPAVSISNGVLMIETALIPMIPVISYFVWFGGVGPALGVPGIKLGSAVRTAATVARAAT